MYISYILWFLTGFFLVILIYFVVYPLKKNNIWLILDQNMVKVKILNMLRKKF